MTIQADFAAYTDPSGLLQPGASPPADSSDNGVLYTCEALVALSDNGALDAVSYAKIMNALYACEDQANLGLLRRNPDGSGGQEAQDDYWGAGLAASFGSSQLPADVLSYGARELAKPHGTLGGGFWSKLGYHLLRCLYWRGVPYVYNNVQPGTFTWAAWLGRYPHLLCHLRMASGQSPSLVQRAWWSGSMALGVLTPASNAGSWALSWCAYRVWLRAGSPGLLRGLAARLWRWRFESAWGNPGSLFSAYFQNPSHPLAVWLKGSV